MERLTEQEAIELLATLRLRVDYCQRKAQQLSDGTYPKLHQWYLDRAAVVRSAYEKLASWPWEPECGDDVEDAS